MGIQIRKFIQYCLFIPHEHGNLFQTKKCQICGQSCVFNKCLGTKESINMKPGLGWVDRIIMMRLWFAWLCPINGGAVCRASI